MNQEEILKQLRDMCGEDDNITELLGELVEYINMIRLTNETDRVLDVEITYKNYRRHSKEVYSKRFKNGEYVYEGGVVNE